MHYDTAQCSNPIALRALRDVVGSSQIVYGTDYFYRTAAESARAVVDSSVFNSVALTSIAHANALRL
jgi:6-methylsalicylate decarboxylase